MPDRFIHHPDDPWDQQADMAAGERMTVELHPAGGYRWSVVESSDPRTAGVEGSVDADGVARFTVSAHQPGTAVLSATTAHTGDRFGPPTRRWRLMLRIAA